MSDTGPLEFSPVVVHLNPEEECFTLQSVSRGSTADDRCPNPNASLLSVDSVDSVNELITSANDSENTIDGLNLDADIIIMDTAYDSKISKFVNNTISYRHLKNQPPLKENELEGFKYCENCQISLTAAALDSITMMRWFYMWTVLPNVETFL